MMVSLGLGLGLNRPPKGGLTGGGSLPPDNALTLNGQVLTLNGQTLTLGA